MGVVERNNYLFLTVTCGHLVNKKKEMSVGAYEGTLLEIKEVEDEFEGNKVKKIEVKMQDNASPEIAIIKFTMEAWYSIGFFARIQKIDVTRPFIIGVMPSDKNEKSSFCYLKQKGMEKIEADKDFPRPEKIDLGDGKTAMKWVVPNERMRAIIKEVNAKVKPAPAAASAAEVVASPDQPEVFTGDGSDDLPF